MKHTKGTRLILSFIACILALSLLMGCAAAETAAAGSPRTSQEIIEELAVYYGTYGSEADGKTAELLEELSAVDPAAGAKWQSIMRLWKEVGSDLEINENILPDGLPDTDELCLIVLGFQLNPDGSMKDELIERLTVAKACAEKYPNALLVCTGGGTAAENPEATEAGEMAKWLIASGVDTSRVIVENQSLTTAQNAIFTWKILTEQFPQVKQLAIISSDYHIATGTLLFGAEATLQAEEAGKEIMTVVSNAAWHAPSGTLSPMFQAGALIELSGDVETAFDIYYETYDIHELPVLNKEESGSLQDRYTLEQVVILSRHNLRAPLSKNGSVPSELTPHSWISWSAGSSELTLLGGMEETSIGQYFRKWLDREGLIPENSIPGEGEVRFNARDKQRCRATARYFAAGMLPLADIRVEHPGDDQGTTDFMQPVLHFYSEDYAADATAQVAAMGGETGFDGLAEQNRDVIRLIMDTVDMQDSEFYRSGKYGNLLTDGFGYEMEANKEPDLTGAVKPAYQVADALLLQYYEEPDAVKAAFGHELTEEDWTRLGLFMTTCLEMKHGAPLVAANIANPLLRELKSELQNEGRKFSFFCAHDCTVLGTLSALGAEDFALPGSIETKAPIGVKLVFERRRDHEGQAWYRVSLVYRSTEQIRSGEMLTLDNPPLQYDLKFEGVGTNADGLISEADLFSLFDRSIGKLDEIEDTYGQADAAALNAPDAIRERGVLRVGTAGDYKPMSFLDPETGTYWGFDTELAEDLAASLGVEIEYVPTSWPTLMEDTLAGKFDLALCGITITDARKEQALMSEGYLENGKTVLCRVEDAEKYTSLEAINQPEVRVMENPGGQNEKFARENLPDATLIIHDVNQEIPGLVASGEADVMITEVMEAGYYVGQDSRLAAPLMDDPFTSGQLGILMPKGSEGLLEVVNNFLEEEKTNGRLDELAEKYIYRTITTEEELKPAA